VAEVVMTCSLRPQKNATLASQGVKQFYV